MKNNTPYDNLHPDLILAAIESIGFQCSGSLLGLNSYENRVYQVGIEEASPVIAKFYRPNRWSSEAILEEHAFEKTLVELDIPVVAPLITHNNTLHSFEGFRFALFPRWGGRALELDNLDQLEWMGRFIGRLHAVGAVTPYQHRPQLNVETHGYKPYQSLIEMDFIPAYLKARYSDTVETVLEKITSIYQEIGSLRYIRVHGDCHVGNILWSETGPHIVDLDDSEMAPAIQDIWMLLSGDNQQMQLQLHYILDGYDEFFDFDRRELRLIEPLRTLRMIQYSAWLANRWEDPAFPRHFPWFNTPHYWEEEIHNIQLQFDRLNFLQ